MQNPSLVLILWTSPPLALSTQAASREGRVVNPGWMVSKTFFLGLRTSRGRASDEKRGPGSVRDEVREGVEGNETKRNEERRKLTLVLLSLKVDSLSGLGVWWRLNELNSSVLAVGRRGLGGTKKNRKRKEKRRSARLISSLRVAMEKRRDEDQRNEEKMDEILTQRTME